VNAAPDRLRRASIVVLFFLSGFCNLVYEVVWARMFDLLFGVTVFAVSAVLASFMLGLATGGAVFGRIADRARSAIGLFAALHVGICLSTVVLLVSFPAFHDLCVRMHTIFGASPQAVRAMVFTLSLFFLLVPTTLMGATFPVATKAVSAGGESLGRDVGTLYSLSTLGSVFGCIATVSVLLESAGMRGTILFAAISDLAIGLAALAADRFLPRGHHTA
jgi:spermidine synthase